VAVQATAARARRWVMSVGSQRGVAAQVLVAALAQRIAFGPFQGEQRALRIFGVRIVATDAAQLRVAVSQQKIPRFTRVDAATARSAAAVPAFPSVRVAREQHRVALGTREVHVLCVGRLRSRRGRHSQEIAAQRE
jgi:hypothetical protein